MIKAEYRVSEATKQALKTTQCITWFVQKRDKESFFTIHTDMVDQERAIPTSVWYMDNQSTIYKINPFSGTAKRGTLA